MVSSKPAWPRFGLIDGTLHIVAGILVVFVICCMFSFSAYYKTDYFAHISTYMDSLSPWADILELFHPSYPLYMSSEGVSGGEWTEVTDSLDKISVRISPTDILGDDDYESLKIFVVPADDLVYKVEGFYDGLSIETNDAPFSEVSYSVNLSLIYKQSTAEYTIQLLNKSEYQVETTQSCKEGERRCGDTCYGVSLDLPSPVVYWGEDGMEEDGFAVYGDRPLKSNVVSYSLLQQAFDIDCATKKVSYSASVTKESGIDTALSIVHSKSPYLDYDGMWGNPHLSVLDTAVAFFILFIISFILFVIDVPIVKLATKKCKERRFTHLKESSKENDHVTDENVLNTDSFGNSEDKTKSSSN